MRAVVIMADALDRELDREVATFEANRDRLLRNGAEGLYVLIKGNEVIGVFDTEAEAQTAGCARFGEAAFLVRQVRVEQPPLTVFDVGV